MHSSFHCSLHTIIVASVLGAGCNSDAESKKATEERLANVDAALVEANSRISKLEKGVGDLSTALRVTQKPLKIDTTGNEVCAEQGKTCLAVVLGNVPRIVDVNNNFCGYVVTDCNSRVSKQLHCLGDSNYIVSPVKFWRSPGSKGQCGEVSNDTCLHSPSDLTAICLE